MKPKTVFFDVNETLLDLTPLKVSVENYLNNEPHLAELWFSKMLHYSLVLNETQQFQTFDKIGLAVLEMICDALNISFSKAEAKETLSTIKKLPAHQDVKSGLLKLKENGFQLKAISNGSQKVLETQLAYAELTSLFDEIISVEKFQTYKPNQKVYRQIQPKSIQPEECLLVAAHAWDLMGANSCGWQTAFVKRESKSWFPLAEKPTYNIKNIEELADLL